MQCVTVVVPMSTSVPKLGIWGRGWFSINSLPDDFLKFTTFHLLARTKPFHRSPKGLLSRFWMSTKLNVRLDFKAVASPAYQVSVKRRENKNTTINCIVYLLTLNTFFDMNPLRIVRSTFFRTFIYYCKFGAQTPWWRRDAVRFFICCLYFWSTYSRKHQLVRWLCELNA